MNYDYRREVDEAIRAGETALYSLEQARELLNSAKNWGIVDILGGSFITDLIKHSKLNKASECIERAKYDLQAFRKELDDVDEYISDLNVGDFWIMADFVFDGLFADLMMQSKISDARRDIERAIYEVRSIVERLRREVY